MALQLGLCHQCTQSSLGRLAFCSQLQDRSPVLQVSSKQHSLQYERAEATLARRVAPLSATGTAIGPTSTGPTSEGQPSSSQAPPDVAPEILLLLSSQKQHHAAVVGSAVGFAGHSQHVAAEQQQQQHAAGAQQQHDAAGAQQQVLVPRTSRRLQGMMQLPGFIPCLAAQPDPQLVLWQQETLEAWQAATAVAEQQQQQQQQRRQQQQQQQQQQQRQLPQQPVHVQEMHLQPGDQSQLQALPQEQHIPQLQQHNDNCQPLLSPDGPSLLALLPQQPTHWAPLAAILQAAGPHLTLQQLLQAVDILHSLVKQSPGAQHAPSSSSNDMLGVHGSVSLFTPDNMTIAAPGAPQPSLHDTSSSPSVRRQVQLQCGNVLPQLCGLLSAQLLPSQLELQQLDGTQGNPLQEHGGQQLQLQEAAKQQPARHLPLAAGEITGVSENDGHPAGAGATAAVVGVEPEPAVVVGVLLPTSATVQLLQQLADLHSLGKLGGVEVQLVAGLVGQHVQLDDCSLAELGVLLLSCARLGYAARASWLQALIRTAHSRLPTLPSAAAAEPEAAAAAAEPEAAAHAEAGSTMQDAGPHLRAVTDSQAAALAADVAQLLDAVARYPGPHADIQQIKPFLDAVQPHLTQASPGDIQALGTAVSPLRLKPGAAWRHAVASAARHLFPSCSMHQLVQLLLGVTAGGFNPQEYWWRAWFAAMMQTCEGLLGAHTGPEWGPITPAVAAAAAASGGVSSPELLQRSKAAAALQTPGMDSGPEHGSDSSSSSSSPGSTPDAGSTLAQVHSTDGTGHVPDSSSSVAGLQSSQHQRQAGAQLSAPWLSTVCLVLLQLGRQVHPLWMAGVLEAYLGSLTHTDLAGTPQLLLLCSRLLEAPPAFAARYKPLMLRLLQPLQHNFNLLNPEQMAQAAEVCAVYRLNMTSEWYRWHGAAILRLGKTFPLEALARVRDAYRTQEVATEQLLQQLLDTVPWRLQRQQELQQQQDRLAAKKAMIGFKMDQRKRQNEADAAKKAAKAAGSSIGMGVRGPGGRANWRKRKLKPPGTLSRKF